MSERKKKEETISLSTSTNFEVACYIIELAYITHVNFDV